MPCGSSWFLGEGGGSQDAQWTLSPWWWAVRLQIRRKNRQACPFLSWPTNRGWMADTWQFSFPSSALQALPWEPSLPRADVWSPHVLVQPPGRFLWTVALFF
jgi:hypothetical protein